MIQEQYAIVADIGGTHARFGRSNLHQLCVDKTATYACADFADLEQALVYYQKEQNLLDLNQVAIAIACPVHHDQIVMTNRAWQFSIAAFKQKLNLTHLQIINDFTAVAMSLPLLTEEDLITIGDAKNQPGKTMLVLGAGTGLGVACLYPSRVGFIPLASEAGHMDWAPRNEQEWFIHQYLSKDYPRVSVERILSGPGLEQIYLALAAHQGLKIAARSAAEIGHLALTKQCELASAAVKQFLSSLGRFAGDLALALNAQGGVYLAGGILPKLFGLLEHSQFRSCFEDKGRFRIFNQQIATSVLINEQPGLLGAAAYLQQTLLNGGLDS